MTRRTGHPEHSHDSVFLPDPPRLGRGLVLGCALAVVGCGAWALMPLRLPAVPPPAAASGEPIEPPVRLALAPLDLAAFRAPLWVSPPPPPPTPAPAAPPPAPPPLKLQLLAVVNEGGIFKAALYDPDTDRITIAGPGDTIAGTTLLRVRAGDVTLSGRGIERTLSLRAEGPLP